MWHYHLVRIYELHSVTLIILGNTKQASAAPTSRVPTTGAFWASELSLGFPLFIAILPTPGSIVCVVPPLNASGCKFNCVTVTLTLSDAIAPVGVSLKTLFPPDTILLNIPLLLLPFSAIMLLVIVIEGLEKE